MKWFDNTAGRLENYRVYSRKELTDMLREDYPYVSSNSYTWAIADMIKHGRLVKIGYNQYQRPGDDIKEVYAPKYSEMAQKVIDLLKEHFPNIKVTLFESVLLNEFMDKKMEKISDNVIFLEAEKDSALPVFRFLQQQGIPNLIYKPTKKDFCFYRTQNSVVITDMTSEAPTSRKNPQEICLEKLLVDIFCDRLIKLTYSFEDYKSIVDTAQTRYQIDKPKLMRYAGRRGKEPQLVELCPGLAVDEWHAKMYRSNSRDEILWAAADIVHSLPESQKEFFDYIGYGKLTQGELAREIYHVRPQAITNRINKLYKTIIRGVCEEKGYNEGEIKRILKYKSKVEFIKMIV